MICPRCECECEAGDHKLLDSCIKVLKGRVRAERDVSRKLAEALEAVNAWLLDLGEPLTRDELWAKPFVKAHKRTTEALALYREST